jgi:hypothetical protein
MSSITSSSPSRSRAILADFGATTSSSPLRSCAVLTDFGSTLVKGAEL